MYSYFQSGHNYMKCIRNLCACKVNPLAHGRSECDSKHGVFNLVLLIGIFRSSHDNALWWMPQDLTDDQSTLVQVMARCRQATSHYLSQCWPRSVASYGVTRPQWVKVYYRIVNLFCVSLPWEKSSTTFKISILGNEVKYKYLYEYIFLQNSLE